MDAAIARAMWRALEPYHATVYFAPESRTRYDEAGLKGYWMGYFASRSAAFGEASPEIVVATFYNFHPKMVHRALPDAWRFASPEAVLDARLDVARVATERLPGDDAQIGEAAELAEAAAGAARMEGRALFAAHARLDWPDEPRLRLWHAATLLREHRGDAHIAALVADDVDGCAAHVLAWADGRVDREWQQRARGWDNHEWDAAAARLHERGILDANDALTASGRQLVDSIEARTDAASVAPYEAIGEAGASRLAELMHAIIGADGPLPFPNPIGLRA